MIEPALKDDLLLADLEAAKEQPDQIHVWWLGQSGFLVEWHGRRLLLDPYLSDSLTLKYAGTDKPHVRMTARVIAPGRLTGISLCTSSHNHTDHLDSGTLMPLSGANPQMEFLAPAANREVAAQRIGRSPDAIRGIDAGETVNVSGFEIHAVPAAHETIERDSLGRMIYLGYVVRCGPWTLYHSGDTVLYDGMFELLQPWHVDIAFLPINGRGASRRVAGNLWGREAAALAANMGAGLVIPCHFDMFEFNTATPEEFVEHCRRLNQPFQVLRMGERWSGKKD
jgi:L-ascorbate metabolism protein UlaG (beta-lactamase superfamily)